MSDYLDEVRRALDEGSADPRQLVLLYRALEEAEAEHDLDGLASALAMAQRLVASSGEGLRPEAEHLVVICEERLQRAHAGAEPGERCPGCGEPLPGSPVRCRSCGTLLV